jgi:hypothetical protein
MTSVSILIENVVCWYPADVCPHFEGWMHRSFVWTPWRRDTWDQDSYHLWSGKSVSQGAEGKKLPAVFASGSQQPTLGGARDVPHASIWEYACIFCQLKNKPAPKHHHRHTGCFCFRGGKVTKWKAAASGIYRRYDFASSRRIRMPARPLDTGSNAERAASAGKRKCVKYVYLMGDYLELTRSLPILKS